jgi:hypothetical protein
MTAQISSLSTEYVEVRLRNLDNDPTDADVDMAFKATGEPETDDWVSATWETRGSAYFARCLVGPEGSTDPGNGSYTVWVRVTADPEIPIIPAGRLKIT